jgi:hypothetical protein
MKQILIPTDFSLSSLDLVEQTAETLNADRMNVILFHVFDMPSGIRDLLFLNKSIHHTNLVSDQFMVKCEALKKRYPFNIHSITLQYVYGDSKSIFKSFLAACGADMIVCPDHLKLRLTHPSSVDPSRLIARCKVPLLTEFRSPATFSFAASRQRTLTVLSS